MRTLKPPTRSQGARCARAATALLCCAGLLFLASAAGASSASLVWVAGAGGVTSGLGTSTVVVSTSVAATLTLDVQIDADGDGMGSGELDFEFDVAADGLDNELDILPLAFEELPGGGWSNPSGSRTLGPVVAGLAKTQESTASIEGQLFGFDAFTLGNGPKNTTLTFARMVFVTNPGNVQDDGADVFNTNERDSGLGLFTEGAVDFSGGPGALAAAVNVPEPGAVAMLGVGVATLVLAGRRGRRVV